MIDETILYLTHTGCGKSPLRKYAKVLDSDPAWDPDMRVWEPLKEVFSKVLRYDFGVRYAEIGVGGTNREITNLVEKENPKYVFWLSMSYEVLESTFQKIREKGSLVIGWFFDDEVRFDNYSKWWIPYLDYILTVDRQSVKRYRELGAMAINLLATSNPNIFKMMPEPEKRYDVSFVGTMYADRADLENELLKRGIQVKTFGRGSAGGYVSVNEMVEIYNSTKVNLCFVKSYDIKTRPQMKNKIFDVCMCGGFLLCEYIPGIEKYFEIGKEIVCFRDIEAATRKIQFYLENERERKKIARAGWERAHRDHCQSAWMSKVFEGIERDSRDREPFKADMLLQTNAPLNVRKVPASFHCRWAKVLMRENFPRCRWSEELKLAFSYDPENVEARRLRLIGRMPGYLRGIFIFMWEALRKVRHVLRSYSILKLASRKAK